MRGPHLEKRELDLTKLHVATRTFFALGGSRFCVTPGNYVMAFFSFSVFKQSLLCLVVIFSPMLVSCCRLIVFFRGCVSLL